MFKMNMNNVTKSALEFIQITRLSRGRAKSPRPRRQVKKDRKRSYCYVENVFGRQRRHRALQPAAVEWVVWIHSIIKNKPNFSGDENVKAIMDAMERYATFY